MLDAQFSLDKAKKIVIRFGKSLSTYVDLKKKLEPFLPCSILIGEIESLKALAKIAADCFSGKASEVLPQDITDLERLDQFHICSRACQLAIRQYLKLVYRRKQYRIPLGGA
jgi:hypothetical protein